jgi:hypothetical protein
VARTFTGRWFRDIHDAVGSNCCLPVLVAADREITPRATALQAPKVIRPQEIPHDHEISRADMRVHDCAAHIAGIR